MLLNKFNFNFRSIPWLLLMALPILMAFSHKFYVSKTMIEYNPRTAQFEVTCKIFTDDLELAIGESKAPEMHLGTDNEAPDANQRIEQYLREHVKLQADGRPLEWRWVGKEVESDLTFCYLEFYRTPDFSTLQVFNDILVAHYPDQQNMVDLIMHGSTQTLLFNKNAVRQDFRR